MPGSKKQQLNSGQGTHQIEVKRNMWHKGPEPKKRKTIQITHHINQIDFTSWGQTHLSRDHEKNTFKLQLDLNKAGKITPLQTPI